MNTSTPILGATGRPMFAMGHQAHAQFETGDYNVSIEWLNDGKTSEPIMLIWSSRWSESGVLGICLSSIGAYADPTGGPNPQGLFRCWESLPMLGRNQIDLEAHRLMDVILRHTPDLIRCPPAPREVRLSDAGSPIWEVTHKDQDGRVVGEASI